jgi:hypothetical protein
LKLKAEVAAKVVAPAAKTSSSSKFMPAICNLQPITYNLQSTIYNLQLKLKTVKTAAYVKNKLKFKTKIEY